VKREFCGFHDLDTGLQPPQLEPCLGLQVKGVWVLDGELYVWLERGMMVRAKAAPAVGEFLALALEVCTCKPGADFSDIVESRDTIYTRTLRGTHFIGLSRNVVAFDNGQGAQLVAGGVEWVKRRAQTAQ